LSITLSVDSVELIGGFGGRVSLRYIAAKTAAMSGGNAARRFGRRYGKVLNIGKVLANLGKLLILANEPPRKEAMRIPRLRHIGKNEKARDSLVSSAISALNPNQYKSGK